MAFRAMGNCGEEISWRIVEDEKDEFQYLRQFLDGIHSVERGLKPAANG
jgi:hypothetical protein